MWVRLCQPAPRPSAPDQTHVEREGNGLGDVNLFEIAMRWMQQIVGFAVDDHARHSKNHAAFAQDPAIANALQRLRSWMLLPVTGQHFSIDLLDQRFVEGAGKNDEIA